MRARNDVLLALRLRADLSEVREGARYVLKYLGTDYSRRIVFRVEQQKLGDC